MHAGVIFGRAIDLVDGDERAGRRLDSADDHYRLWDDDALKKPSGLKHFDYTEIPRGRVMFSIDETMPIVYLDEVLCGDDSKAAIKSYFELGDGPIRWELDPHYTTDPEKLQQLLDREFGDGDL